MPSPSSSSAYACNLGNVIKNFDWSVVDDLAEVIFCCWKQGKLVLTCGNGGSAANANHLANDFIYGANPSGFAIRVISLADNSSILTCLGNDTGYENIFAKQLITQAREGDLLLVFSGSGNSPNLIKAISTAKMLKIRTAAILGFDGGKCKQLVDYPIHFPVNDMQISEDLQQIVGHMLTLQVKQQIATANNGEC